MKYLSGTRTEDVTGQRFNELTAISFSHVKNYKAHWNFQCTCGNKVVKGIYNVKKGNPKSCSKCFTNKQLTQKILKQVLLYNPWTGYFYRKLRDNTFITVGTIGTNGYVLAGIGKKTYRMHRLAYLYVWGYLPETDIDHKDRIKYHNWISNLREASRMCNARNSTISKNNTSGVTGVTYNKINNKWKAQIKVNYKNINLGSYINFNTAVIARWNAEVLHDFPSCNISSTAYNYLKENNLI